MTAKRTFYAMLTGVVFLVGLCIVGTYYANKLLVREGANLFELKLQKAVLSKQETALLQAKKDIAEYQQLETIAKTVVPQEKDQARTTLELLNLAKESNITISSISFPNSELGEIVKKKATKAEDDGEEKTEAKPKQSIVDSNTTQLTPLPNLKGVYAMEIIVTSDTNKQISYEQLIDYLKRLENNRRTAQVKNLSIQPSEDDRSKVSFSLTLNSYVRP